MAQANTRGLAAQDKAIVSFNAGDELGKFYFGESNAKLYIPQNGKELAIATAARTGELPLNFKATKNGEYTLRISIDAAELDYLHLIDNLNGADVDLLHTNEYTFTAKTSDYASRFKLVFEANEEDGVSTGSTTFAYYNGSEWVINNEGMATLQVIDALGRVLSSETISGNAKVNISVVVKTNILLLPDQPMRRRQEDWRVGYFSKSSLQYSDEQQEVKNVKKNHRSSHVDAGH